MGKHLLEAALLEDRDTPRGWGPLEHRLCLSGPSAAKEDPVEVVDAEEEEEEANQGLVRRERRARSMGLARDPSCCWAQRSSSVGAAAADEAAAAAAAAAELCCAFDGSLALVDAS